MKTLKANEKMITINNIDEETENKLWENAKKEGKIKLQEQEGHSNLAQEIRDNAFTGAIVYALQRKGKSSYAMQVMYELYGNWDDVFKNMFYRIDDLTNYLYDRLGQDEPLPCVLWDDAGVHASKLLYFKDKDQADMIKRLFDVMGVATQGILLTTPVPDELLKSLRSYEFLKIKIMDESKYGRLARCYKNVLWPSGTRRNPKYFEDHFDVRLPDEIYQRYSPIRKGYYIQSLRDLRDTITTKKLEASVKKEQLARIAAELGISADTVNTDDVDRSATINMTELDKAAKAQGLKLRELETEV